MSDIQMYSIKKFKKNIMPTFPVESYKKLKIC